MTNYQAGATLERATLAALRANGYFGMKSGGSKGPADVIAIKRGEILLVQCKAGNGWISPADRIELYEIAAELGARPLIATWLKEGRAARTVDFAELVHIPDAARGIVKIDWTPDYGLREQTG